jgi:ribosomal protein L12E/L44/L45/RPP1/RPP2
VTVSKTALGAQVMKDRSVPLSAQQRSALILCDGKRSAEEVVKMTSAVGVTLQDMDALAKLGLIDIPTTLSNAAAPAAMPSASGQLSAVASTGAPQADANQDFAAALNAAITLCSNLGFKGFGLNMALTGVDSLEKLQKLAPEIRRVAGDVKYKALHEQIFGKPL